MLAEYNREKQRKVVAHTYVDSDTDEENIVESPSTPFDEALVRSSFKLYDTSNNPCKQAILLERLLDATVKGTEGQDWKQDVDVQVGVPST
jgi:hypothetical protein